MCLVVVFFVFFYFIIVYRIVKFFNFMLGEIFEFDRFDDMGLRFFCE